MEKFQAEAGKLQSLLQIQDIAIGTLISELKQGDCEWNIKVDKMPVNNQYKFGEHREELVANLISELSPEEGITSHILKPEKVGYSKGDELLKGTKSKTNSIHSKLEDSKHDGYYGKPTLKARNNGSEPEREGVYFGSISNVWYYGKEFCVASVMFYFLIVSSLAIILPNIPNIPLARLLGLDVDSIISKRRMHSELTLTSCTKWQSEFQCEVHLNIGIFIFPLCLFSLLFQLIVHPIVSCKISGNGLISGIKYGCRYFVIHVGVMLIAFTCLFAYVGLLYKIIFGAVTYCICTTSLLSCVIQFIPPAPVRWLMNTMNRMCPRLNGVFYHHVHMHIYNLCSYGPQLRNKVILYYIRR